MRDSVYDAAVTMYHDQGQIAIKLLTFDEGVSVLGSLSIPITARAHGKASDITGKIKPMSFLVRMRCACV